MNKTLKIHDLSEQDRPRERLIQGGAHVLNDYELLAVLLGKGSKGSSVLHISQKLLKEFGGFKGLLEANKQQLTSVYGIGDAGFATLKAALEISKRINNSNQHIGKSKIIRSPNDIIEIVKNDLLNKQREHLLVISLDSRNKFISKDLVSMGTVNTTLVTPREIFKIALSRNAVSIILVHNHPSQDTTPSREDIFVTESVSQLGKELNVPLIDHIIFSDNDFLSLKSLGLFETYEIKKKGGENEK